MAGDPSAAGAFDERRGHEIAFEVADSESTAHVTAKARKLVARGVRRMFYVRVEDRSVHEWDRAAADWRALGADAEIVDRFFSVPIPVRALADEVLAA